MKLLTRKIYLSLLVGALAYAPHAVCDDISKSSELIESNLSLSLMNSHLSVSNISGKPLTLYTSAIHSSQSNNLDSIGGDLRDENHIEVNQNGRYNSIELHQFNRNNLAVIEQDGHLNQVYLSQLGDKQIKITQIGVGITLYIQQ